MKGWETDPHDQSTSSTGAIAQEWEIGVPRIFDFHTAKVRLELGAQRQKWSHGGRKKRRDCLKSTFVAWRKLCCVLVVHAQSGRRGGSGEGREE